MNRTATLTAEQRTLKAASKALIRAAGGQEAASEFCGRTQGRLSEYGSPTVPLFMPLDVLDKLEAMSPEPIVTKYLAARRGYALFPLPETGPVERDWHKHLMRLAKEPADITAGICAALSDDGAVTRREIRDGNLIAETRQAIGVLVELLAVLESVESGED